MSYHITYMWNLTDDTNELIYKTETYCQRKQIYGYQSGKRWGIDKLGVQDQQMKTTRHKEQCPTV